MSRIRVASFGVSLDGYGAGPDQSIDHPLGRGGMALASWFHPTRTFHEQVLHRDSGETGPDDDIARRGMANIGAWILGRNMFGPVRGPWPDDSWKGWWGEEPPYHTDVYVLTHHPRDSFEMRGGTVFHFVTGGIHEALERARVSAGERDVRIGGGVSVVRQYLEAGLVDELHVAVVPALLGAGERLLGAVDLAALGFSNVEYLGTARAAHYVLTKQAGAKR